MVPVDWGPPVIGEDDEYCQDRVSKVVKITRWHTEKPRSIIMLAEVLN